MTSYASERVIFLDFDGVIVTNFKPSGMHAGFPSNGGKSKTPALAGLVEEVAGPLHLCGAKALHGTMSPDKWKGDRLWIVALYGEVQWQDDKCGALKREILAEIKP